MVSTEQWKTEILRRKIVYHHRLAGALEGIIITVRARTLGAQWGYSNYPEGNIYYPSCAIGHGEHRPGGWEANSLVKTPPDCCFILMVGGLTSQGSKYSEGATNLVLHLALRPISYQRHHAIQHLDSVDAPAFFLFPHHSLRNSRMNDASARLL